MKVRSCLGTSLSRLERVKRGLDEVLSADGGEVLEVPHELPPQLGVQSRKPRRGQDQVLLYTCLLHLGLRPMEWML